MHAAPRIAARDQTPLLGRVPLGRVEVGERIRDRLDERRPGIALGGPEIGRGDRLGLGPTDLPRRRVPLDVHPGHNLG